MPARLISRFALLVAVLGLSLASRASAQLDGGARSTPVSVDEANAQTQESQPVSDVESLEPDLEPEPRDTSTDVAAETQSYGTVARSRRQPTSRAQRLETNEARDIPGTFGDPFRAIDTLPGMVPVASGTPYIVARGAPATSNAYVFDGISLPTLFHLALGPAVVHPRMIGPLTLHSAGAAASFGRATGAIIEADGPRAIERVREVDLRAIDVNGFVSDSMGSSTDFALAGRYGYPGLLFSAFSSDVNLSYWDYQARVLHRTRDDDFALVALGAYDNLVFSDSDANDFSQAMQFHRAEFRWSRTRNANEFGSAFLFGFDKSVISEKFDAYAFLFRPRLWWKRRVGTWTFRSGIDMESHLQEGGGTEFLSEGNDSDDEALRTTAYGVFFQSDWQPIESLRLGLGARADLWIARSDRNPVVTADPRVRVEWKPSQSWTLFSGAGTSSVRAGYVPPFPGVSTSAGGDLFTQRAWQLEFGTRHELSRELTFEAQTYIHRYEEAPLLNEGIERYEHIEACTRDGRECTTRDVSLVRDAASYGLETMVRWNTSRVRGWLSYSLARALTDEEDGIGYTQQFDIRHLLNLVADARIAGGFHVGTRVHVRSGKGSNFYELVLGETSEQDSIRQYMLHGPTFFRVDASMSYEWRSRYYDARLGLEWLNVTLSREPLALRCDPYTAECTTLYAPAIFAPNVSARVTW